MNLVTLRLALRMNPDLSAMTLYEIAGYRRLVDAVWAKGTPETCLSPASERR